MDQLVPISKVELGSTVEIAGKVGIWGGGELASKDSFVPYLIDPASGRQVGVVIAGNYPKLDDPVRVIETSSPREILLKQVQSWKLYLQNWGHSSGCDPEMFVKRKDGRVLPAWEFLEDKKVAQDRVRRVEESPYHSEWYYPKTFWDGFQAEVAPAGGSCLEVLGENIKLGLQDVVTKARRVDTRARLVIDNAVRIPEDELRVASPEHVGFRCSTSLNVYEDAGEQPDAKEYQWRFAGGHVHVGLGQRTAPTIRAVVKGLDGILGVAGVSMAGNFDNPERRRMYGKAGEFRLPAHGIEYRVLSNFWMCSPPIFHLTFELMRLATRFALSGMYGVFEAGEQEVRDVINWHDVRGAREIIKRNLHVYQWLIGLVPSGWSVGAQDRALRVIQGGIEEGCKDPREVEKNWRLFDPEWRIYGKGKGGSWKTAE